MPPVIRTWRERMLDGMRAECAVQQDDAARLDAAISGPHFDPLTGAEKVMLLRRHAGLVERIWDVAVSVVRVQDVLEAALKRLDL